MVILYVVLYIIVVRVCVDRPTLYVGTTTCSKTSKVELYTYTTRTRVHVRVQHVYNG